MTPSPGTSSGRLSAFFRGYCWWPPLEQQKSVALVSPRSFVAAAVSVLPLGVVPSLPPVVRATGIRPAATLGILGAFVGWIAISVLVLGKLRRRWRPAIHVAAAGNLLLITSLACAFPVLAGEPRSVFWAAPVMYACLNGAERDFGPSFGLLAVHLLLPIATIPFFLAAGAPPGWSIAAPLICAALSFSGYHYLAGLNVAWHEVARQGAEALAAARRAQHELEQRQLAQDLHDSVGSALSLVGLYGELVGQLIDRPDELRQAAATLQEAAREGLVELRGVLEAIAPRAASLESLRTTLAAIGTRVTALTQVPVEMAQGAPEMGGDEDVPGAMRLAIVRIFQEAVSNAVRHGAPHQVRAQLWRHDHSLRLEVVDDGRGFIPGSAGGGRGLEGMRARAAALGGTLVVESQLGAGARIEMTLPLVRAPK